MIWPDFITNSFLKPFNQTGIFLQDTNTLFALGTLAALGTAATLIFLAFDKSTKPTWKRPIKNLPLPPTPLFFYPLPQIQFPQSSVNQHYQAPIPPTHHPYFHHQPHYSYSLYKSPDNFEDLEFNLENRKLQTVHNELSGTGSLPWERVYEALFDERSECAFRLVCQLGRMRDQKVPLHAAILRKFLRGEISSTAGDLLKKDKTYFAYQTAYHAGFTGKDCRSLSKACSISPGYLWKHFLLMNPLRYAYNNRH